MANQSSITLLHICFFFLCFSSTSSTNFSFSSFAPNDFNISVDGRAIRTDFFNHPSILLTSNQFGGDVINGSGKAYYSQPIQLFIPNTNISTDFTTYFEFSINFVNSNSGNLSSGGLAFFLASENSLAIPADSGSGWLGLFNETTDNDTSNQIVAVEFDTFKDQWDPSNNHVGIDVNSIVSKTNRTWNNSMTTGDIYGARISYNGTTKNLNVHVKDPDIPNDSFSLIFDYNVSLPDFLPEKVFIGFSASTGQSIVNQAIRTWNFTSTLDLVTEKTSDQGGGSSKKWVVWVIVGVVGFVLAGMVLIFAVWWKISRKKKMKEEDYEDEEIGIIDDSIDEDFVKGTGPKRFTYKELVEATNNFSEEGKLGQGGFGGVYKGILAETNMEIAVKKISSGSSQGKKEYVSEVKTISRLRHRNLVQLVGWSHERGSFILVYEYMPNGSLDHHLFGKKSRLTWQERYKIAHGLASGLLYLHEEWEQCVVHRDIKSSNVMLDSNFNAKLGDFGLARLVDHGLGSQTTVLAGTMGYLAPECVITSRSSTESDVYSFGVVALEIACGRKPVEPRAEESKVRLLNWVWEMYGKGMVHEVVDQSLNGEYDDHEMMCLISVGLWCAHPDHNLRPSIREAIKVLNFEAPLPSLPSQMPMPTYFAPAMSMSSQFEYTLTSEARSENYAPSTTSTTNESILSGVPSSKSLL